MFAYDLSYAHRHTQAQEPRGGQCYGRFRDLGHHMGGAETGAVSRREREAREPAYASLEEDRRAWQAHGRTLPKAPRELPAGGRRQRRQRRRPRPVSPILDQTAPPVRVTHRLFVTKEEKAARKVPTLARAQRFPDPAPSPQPAAPRRDLGVLARGIASSGAVPALPSPVEPPRSGSLRRSGRWAPDATPKGPAGDLTLAAERAPAVNVERTSTTPRTPSPRPVRPVAPPPGSSGRARNRRSLEPSGGTPDLDLPLPRRAIKLRLPSPRGELGGWGVSGVTSESPGPLGSP